MFSTSRQNSASLAWIALWTTLAVMVVIACLTLDVDHPFGIATSSRALYVDGGFYSDAAQNWVKFDQWAFDYDSRHWVGTPFLAVLRAQIFSWFGVSLEVARLSSILLSVVTCAAFYGIVRTTLGPWLSLLVTLGTALTIVYTGHARSALAEPTALALALLSLLVYTRTRNKTLAIPLSIALAGLSFLSKLLFLHVLVAVVTLWVIELLLLPLLSGKSPDKRNSVLLFVCLSAGAALGILGMSLFHNEISTFRTMLSDKKPVFNAVALAQYLALVLAKVGGPTKTHVFSWSLLVSILGFVTLFLYRIAFKPRAGSWFSATGYRPGRAETSMAVWLIVGLALVGSMSQHKPHYFLFAIFPVCFLGAAGVRLLVPTPLSTFVICALVIAHVWLQVPYYKQWSERSLHTALFDASRDLVRLIHGENRARSEQIPVMGEYSAQLGLFSDRILSLDFYWQTLPYADFCHRLEVWRPRFHVNIVTPGGGRDSRATRAYAECRSVSGLQEVRRYPLPEPETRVILLRRIHYRS